MILVPLFDLKLLTSLRHMLEELQIGGTRRILGYGDVTIFGVGEGRKTIAMIASPLQFRNHITAR